MAAKSYSLDFGGYWREPNVAGLPAVSGVYGVYACTYDLREKAVSLRRLLYIGEAADIRNRVTCHERWNDWQRAREAGEELCFNAAAIGPQDDRERAEAAMIHEHKPPLNIEFMRTFPYDVTVVATTGRNALMKAMFAVYPTQALGRDLLTGGLGQRW